MAVRWELRIDVTHTSYNKFAVSCSHCKHFGYSYDNETVAIRSADMHALRAHQFDMTIGTPVEPAGAEYKAPSARPIHERVAALEYYVETAPYSHEMLQRIKVLEEYVQRHKEFHKANPPGRF